MKSLGLEGEQISGQDMATGTIHLSGQGPDLDKLNAVADVVFGNGTKKQVDISKLLREQQIEPGESLEDAVVREVYEEVQVQLEDIRYVSSQPWPFPASAMCGFYAEAMNRNSGVSEEVEETRWFTVESLTQAVIDEDVRLSPPVSIAFRLLADWFRKNGGGDLEALVRRQRAVKNTVPTC